MDEASQLLTKNIRPEECALLIAPPLDFDAFQMDVAMSHSSVPVHMARGDYAYNMARSRATPKVKAAWDRDGQVVASLCRALIADAKSAGVQVFESASEKWLRKAADSSTSVIVIVAHWRGPRVAVHDLRVDQLLNTLRALQSSSDALSQYIYACLQSVVPRPEGNPRASELADALSSAICEKAGHPRSRPDEHYMNDQTRVVELGKMRDQFDERLPDFLVPGNCIEFRDGYYKAEQVLGMFPEDWDGIIELAACHSLYLAEVLKGRRDGRRIITNELAKHPERCIPELQETFLRLSVGGHSYVRIRLEVFSTYSRYASSLQ